VSFCFSSVCLFDERISLNVILEFSKAVVHRIQNFRLGFEGDVAMHDSLSIVQNVCTAHHNMDMHSASAC